MLTVLVTPVRSRDIDRFGDAGLRERLILHYTPLVKYVAGRVGVAVVMCSPQCVGLLGRRAGWA